MNLNKLYLQHLFLTCHWRDSHNICIYESEYYICIAEDRILMLIFHLYFDPELHTHTHTHRFCERVLMHVCQKRQWEMQWMLEEANWSLTLWLGAVWPLCVCSTYLMLFHYDGCPLTLTRLLCNAACTSPGRERERDGGDEPGELNPQRGQVMVGERMSQ